MNFVFPDIVKQVQAFVEDILGESIIGIYLFGSAVVSGLRDDSDVDILVAVNEPLTLKQRKDLITQLMAVSGVVGNTQFIRPVELTIIAVSDVVPWHFPPQAEFVYGEWLRKELETGNVLSPVVDPDLAIVLKQVVDNSFPLYGKKATELFEPVPIADIHKAIRESLPTLLSEKEGDERNVVLTLSRMWLTAATGNIASKDVAAEWAEQQLPPNHSALLKYARNGYLGKVKDLWVGKQEELDAFVSYMRELIAANLDT
nr:aminoglycoside adenylyltransferase family protein [Shewanella algae]